MTKIENDTRYDDTRNHRRPLQTRLAHDLHEKANVSIGPCGLEEVKQFQTCLSDYQINIVLKDHQNPIIYSGPEKEKSIYGAFQGYVCDIRSGKILHNHKFFFIYT